MRQADVLEAQEVASVDQGLMRLPSTVYFWSKQMDQDAAELAALLPPRRAFDAK